MHTAQHLVGRCLGGQLAGGRTIILVTHHITLCLPIASYLIELEKGRIKYQGSIPELEQRGLLSRVIDAEEEPFAEPLSPLEQRLIDADNMDEEGDATPPRPSSRNGKLVEAEGRAEGRVSMQSYVTYITAGGIVAWICTLVIQTLIRVINVGNQVMNSSNQAVLATDRPSCRSFLLGGAMHINALPHCLAILGTTYHHQTSMLGHGS